MLDKKIRDDFPILKTKVHGKPLVYLDNAATTQKPQIVIDKIVELYQTKNSNIHRGVHHLSNVATEEYENSRIKVQEFIKHLKVVINSIFLNIQLFDFEYPIFCC